MNKNRIIESIIISKVMHKKLTKNKHYFRFYDLSTDKHPFFLISSCIIFFNKDLFYVRAWIWYLIFLKYQCTILACAKIWIHNLNHNSGVTDHLYRRSRSNLFMYCVCIFLCVGPFFFFRVTRWTQLM
jgi:fatty acid desaturase